MISFVRPGMLGLRQRFTRDFVTPIVDGQLQDATEASKQLSKERLFVLHQLLAGSVHRADLRVLAEYLPPKYEYVLSVNMSDTQKQLYCRYLERFQAGKKKKDPTAEAKRLFAAYHELAKVWTHPAVLHMERGDIQERESKAYDSIDDFCVDSSDEQWSDECPDDEFDMKRKKKGKKKRKKEQKVATKAAAAPASDEQWWGDLMSGAEELEDATLSGKMVILLELLKEAAAKQEKLLLFSQSLLVLELIERILDRSGRWKLGRDYFRLDGSTNSKTRQGWVERFNDAHQHRARLFLISTKAGGLGVNLTAANRVVIFDAAWNPSIDTQAVFRAFRFGQEKPVYVYRLLAQGTMEEKIYWRQVSKNALASRVVDQEQAKVGLTQTDLSAAELFQFTPAGDGSGQHTALCEQTPADPVLARCSFPLANCRAQLCTGATCF